MDSVLLNKFLPVNCHSRESGNPDSWIPACLPVRQTSAGMTDCQNLISQNSSGERIRNKRGQALVELAALGTVLVFCMGLLISYGMTENYSQEAMMKTFRKAFVRARSGDPSEKGRTHNAYNPGWEYENTEPALPSNRWANVSYTVIEDKVLPSTGEVLNVDERSPVGASASATCSMHLFHEKDDADIPRLEYEINGKRYSFTSAAIVSYKEVNHSDVRTKKTKDPWDGTGKCWEWELVENPGKGMSADVDKDSYEEEIMEVEMGQVLAGVDDAGTPITIVNSTAYIISAVVEDSFFFKENDEDVWKPIDGNPHREIHEIDLTEDEAKRATDDYITVRRAWVRYVNEDVLYEGRRVTAAEIKLERKLTFKFTDWELTFKVVDYQEGEVNPEGENDGLQPDYGKIMAVEDSSFTREEDEAAITTTEQINAGEGVFREIRTKDGIYRVNDVFPVQETTTWETPHE